MSYRKILIAVDLSEYSEQIARRALLLAESTHATVHLMHVVEYLPIDPAGEAMMATPMAMGDELAAAAQQRLNALARKLDLPDCVQHVAIGNIKTEIIRIATEIEADLIVLGNLEKHGLAILFGSSSKAVLSAAPCDVLAVRLSGSTD